MSPLLLASLSVDQETSKRQFSTSTSLQELQRPWRTNGTQRGLLAQTTAGTPFKERLRTGKTQPLRKHRSRRHKNDNNTQDTERCMMDVSLQFPHATSASTERLLDDDVTDCRIEDNKKVKSHLSLASRSFSLMLPKKKQNTR